MRISHHKESAHEAFMKCKIEIDAMLTLGYYAELLKRITDSAFQEGEYAE